MAFRACITVTNLTVAFRNSESAFRRWSLSMTQRAMAVTELKTFAGLELGETAAAQCQPSRIRKDHKQMTALSDTINQFCNPFSPETSTSLVNIATGQATSKNTETYLLNTLKRGSEARDQFQSEWDKSSSRFLERVKRTRVQNFASENVKSKTKLPADKMARTNAESMRDAFIRMIVVAAENSTLDLQNILSYPITKYPLSMAHCDGSLVKTDKSALLNKLESMQTTQIMDSNLPNKYAQVFDGGLLLHSIMSTTNIGASYASIARRFLSVLCSGKSTEVHLCLDKYVDNSIKGSERKLCGAVDAVYKITGPQQTIRQSGQKLLLNGNFKNELAKFLLKEWGNDHYWNFLAGKTLYASYGGECYQYVPDELQKVIITKPPHLQGDHEEADTLIAFHIANITERDIIVRASDTDVLVILTGAFGQHHQELRSRTNIIMDCGIGNSRRFINVSDIANVLDQRQPGLARALPGYHAFTGCDFTSAFFRKGKVKALETVEKDKNQRFIKLFTTMGETDNTVDAEVASEFVCTMYGQTKAADVNEARYKKLLQMTGKIDQENPLANVKKIDCALLPPSRKTLEMKLLRTSYVTILWSRASASCPGDGLCPTDYGWCSRDSVFQPVWFQGPEIPDRLFRKGSETITEVTENDDDDDKTIIGDESDIQTADELSESDDEPWSEDSDSDTEVDD